MKPIALTIAALTAFAFNSILCRMALAPGEIDAASFTGIRLISGVAMLYLLSAATGRSGGLLQKGNWASGGFLFAYAACFSFAYISLTTATGALILFGSVQMTMIAAGIAKGERPGLAEWAGLFIAMGGLVYLVLPGLSSPPLVGSLLMAAAGAAWAGYTLRGRRSGDPLGDTLGNFARTVPMAIILAAFCFPQIDLSQRGVILAVLSGALASGVGYTIWYSALKYHTATRAAVLQLSVPVIAAAGGVLLLAETASPRLTLAGVLILGGIALTIFGRKTRSA